MSSGFKDAVRNSLASNAYTEAPAHLFPRGTFRATVAVPLTNEIRALMSKDVAGRVNVLLASGRSPTWGGVYIVDRLRDAAFKLVAAPKLGMTAAERFYASPEAFDQLVAQALATFLQGGIHHDVPYQFEGRNVTIRYRLSHGELLPRSQCAEVQAMAF
ncbi:MAG: hypothetical protein ACK5Q5_23985 [Planctomycetaceae bacterium]